MNQTKKTLYALGLFCYLPPVGIGHVEAFLENLDRFPSNRLMHFFGWNCKLRPNVIQLAVDPDSLKESKSGNPRLVANAVFFTALQMAQEQNYTHMMFCEEDCRFGEQGWDQRIWEEFVHKSSPNTVCGGSPVVFNPCAWGREAAEAFENFMERTQPRLMPISVCGGARLAERIEPAVFVNGALAIYNVASLMNLYGAELQGHGIVRLSSEVGAYDYDIGKRLWRAFDLKAYDYVESLSLEYSGYGNAMITEKDRMGILTEHSVVAIHQIKSDWTGPEK